jgi:hypothetical protein
VETRDAKSKRRLTTWIKSICHPLKCFIAGTRGRWNCEAQRRRFSPGSAWAALTCRQRYRFFPRTPLRSPPSGESC